MPDEQEERQALFPGLVYNEQGEPADVVYIAGMAHYAIPDMGFRRHVEAYRIDNAVIAALKAQITSMQGEVVRGMLQMLGTDDLFTKAAIDASIRNLDKSIRQSSTSQVVPWLKLFGFRVVVDVHGEIVEIIYPEAPPEERGDDE
ncbi:MAG: hypothetical protein ACYC4R_15955 [Anaerolineae bacterium]